MIFYSTVTKIPTIGKSKYLLDLPFFMLISDKIMFFVVVISLDLLYIVHSKQTVHYNSYNKFFIHNRSKTT